MTYPFLLDMLKLVIGREETNMVNESEIIKTLAEVEARGKSNTHRLDDVEKRQDNMDKLVTSVAVMATRQEAIESDVTEIKSDVKSLTCLPSKRWNDLVDKIIWLVCGGVLAYMLGKFLEVM